MVRPRPLLTRALVMMGVMFYAGLPGLEARAADVIGTIVVTGNRTIDTDTVRSYVKLAPGSPYDRAKSDATLKSLFATGLFADVRIDRLGPNIEIRVVENPVIGTVAFVGNSEVDKKKLDEIARLKPQGRYTAAKAHADARLIREHYQRLGRMATTVETKTVPQPNGAVELLFTIKEAPVTRIDRIVFTGNAAFSEGQLRDVLSTSQSGWFDILKTAAFLDPQRLESDADLVRTHYRNNGYPDVRVGPPEFAPNAEGSAFTVTFKVEEGDRTTFGAVRLESAMQGVDTVALASSIAVTPGSLYAQEKIEKTVEGVSRTLSETGHVAARVKPVLSRKDSRADIVFRIEEGPRQFVERIDITGNTKTKDVVIRRQLRLAEGDPVNAFLIERGRARVQALGFFKSVALKVTPGSSPDRLVVGLVVVEDETLNLGFGVGYSTAEGVVGDVSAVERNLFGNGQQLRLKVAGSFTRLQADIGFTEPHILGSKVSGGFDVLYRDVDYTKQASYKSQKVGGTVRLGYPITDTVTGGINYSFVRSTLYDVGPNASAAIKEALNGSASNTYDTSSVGYSLAYDTRDKKKNPSSGVYFSLAQDLAGAGGDVRYIRSVGEARAYYAVNDSVTLAGRAQGGIIGGWGGQDVRLLDMFYKGNEVVRGFAPAGIGPRDTLSVNQDALGGRMFVGSSAEVLFQLPGVPRDLGLRGAVFFDAGSLWGVSRTASALPGISGTTPSLRASVGTGLAWDSPIGALRVDYAFPILKQTYDKTQALSFGLSPF